MEGHDPAPLILIADDSPSNLELLSAALTPVGLEVAVAFDGNEVLEIVKHSEPELILLDAIMPKLDGFETCRRLKQDPATEHIPVIFMTSLTDMHHRVAGFNAGAVDYVTKPFEHAELLARVRAQLSLRRATQTLKENNALLQKEIQERATAQQALTAVVRELENRTEELRDAHVRLVKLEKHATEVRMAGGFAHEMRNALASAKLRLGALYKRDGETVSSVFDDNAERLAELARMWPPHLAVAGVDRVGTLFRGISDSEQKASVVLSGISRDIDRALNVTARILEYSKQGFESPGRQVIDVDKLIGNIMHGIEQSLSEHDIRVSTDIDPTCRLRGTESHFFSILSNLIINARDALASITDGRERVIEIRLRREDSSFTLEVSDTGVGIPPEHRAKIFEPFFSTKPNTGTGLGLSLVEKLVLLYGGTIDVQSEPNHGTTIRLRFPEETAPASA